MNRLLAFLAAFFTAALHAQTPGALDGGFAATFVGDTILSSVAQPDGKILIGGTFSSVNGVDRNNIARLNADGSVEGVATFNPGTGASGTVYSIAVQPDGMILIAGGFTSVNGQPRNRIARLNPDGSVESTSSFILGTGADSGVYCVALQRDGKILIGGDFTSINGQPRNRIARLNADGTLEGPATFDPGTGASGVIYSIAVRPDGKILIGGGFTSVNGQPRNRIARLEANGALESIVTFNVGTGANDEVLGVALQADGKAVIGGNFTSVDGQPRTRIARLNSDGSIESTSTFNVGSGANNPVNGLAIQADGKILIAGGFSNVGGTGRSKIARLYADGSVEAGGTFEPDTSGFSWINSVTVQSDGKIVVGGFFVSGQPQAKIARLVNDPASQSLTVLSDSLVRWMRSGAVPESDWVTFEVSTDGGGTWSSIGDGVRIVGGWERAGSALPPNGMIRARGRTTGGYFNGSSGIIAQIASFDFQTQAPTLSTVGSVQYQGRTMSVDFSLPEAAQSGSVKLIFDNGMTQTTFTLGPAFETQGVHSLTFDPDAPNASGHFASATALADGTYTITLSYQDALGNAAATSAGVMNVGVSSVPVPGSLDSSFTHAVNGSVLSTSVQPDGKIVIGGNFTAPGNHIARLNADGSFESVATFNPGTGVGGGAPFVSAVQPDGKIVIACIFTSVNGVPRNNIARLNADGSLDLSFNPNADGIVYALALQGDGKIIIGGFFNNVGGTSHPNVARLNADGTLDTSFDPQPSGPVFSALVQTDGKIVLSGIFTDVGGESHPGIVRVNANGTLDASFHPDPILYVRVAAEQADGKIVIGGTFTSVGSTNRPFIARLNADGTLDTGYVPQADGQVDSITLQADGKAIIAGQFTHIGGVTRNHIAKLGADGTLDADFDPNPDPDNDKLVYGVTLDADGRVIAAGAFTMIGGGAQSFLARLNNDAATQAVSATSAARVQWLRGGAVPETQRVTFELSVDAGAHWTPLAAGARIAGGWEATGLNLAGLRGSVRARAFTSGGYFNGSSGIVEQTAAFDFDTTGGFTVAPTLTAPAMDSTTKSPVTVTFTLPEPALAGMVKLQFDRTTGGLTRTLTLAPSQESAGEHTFTFDPANPLASAAVASITGGATIPDLAYHVTLSYQDTLGNLAASAVSTNVKIDTITQAPALLSFPQSGGTLGGVFSSGNASTALLISLPEAALPGSVTFTFDDGTTQYVFTTTSAISAQGSNQIVFKPSDPVGASYLSFPVGGSPLAFASGPSAVPDGGPYAISFTYQDAAGNTAVQSNIATGVIVDTSTQSPTLTAPVANALYTTSIDVSYTLPEAAFDGSAVLGFTGTNGTSGSYFLSLTSTDATAGAHSFTFDPRDPTASGHFTSGSAIPDGTYTVSLTYSDAVLNPSASASKTGVRVDTQPPSFVDPTPTGTLTFEAEAGGGKAVTFTFAVSDIVDPAPTIVLTAGLPSGAVFPFGFTTVAAKATDAAGNFSTASFVVHVQDTIAPTLAPPTGGFAPLTVYAGSTLADYAVSAVATDATTVTKTQNPPAGTVLNTVGTTHVVITGTDQGNNAATLELDVVVRPANAKHDWSARAGDVVPNAGDVGGPPAGAKATTFGVPAVDETGAIAYVGQWITTDKKKGAGLFADAQCLAVVGGDASSLAGTGATFKSFSDPVIDGGNVATIGTFAGVAKTANTAVLSNVATGGALEIVARVGDVAPDKTGAQPAGGVKFKSFKGAAIHKGAVGFLAQLASGTVEKVTPANDLALYYKVGSNAPQLVMREGASIEVALGDNRTIKTLVSFATGADSPGQGRGWLAQPYGDQMLALVTFTDKTQAVVSSTASGTQVFALTGVTGSGGPDVTDAKFASFSFPATNDRYTTTFLASLTPGAGVVTKADARGVFVSGGSSYTRLANVGGDAGATGAKFSVLKDPVLSGDDSVAFTATLKGGGLKPPATASIWARLGSGSLALLAQGGTDAADLPGAKWKAFTSLAIAAPRGPIFTATLVPNKTNVTAKSATGVWACDFLGSPRLLFRTDDPIDLGDQGTKKLKSFTLLKTSVGNVGVTRSFNEAARVVWLATFVDKTQAIITSEVP